jgi:GGDEF domain-containing protein
VVAVSLGFDTALFGHRNAPVGWGTQTDASASSDTRAAATLEGDVKNIPAAGILQSIMMSQLTGLLSVADESEEIKIYFVDGMPTHGTSIETTGDRTVLEVLTWDKGRFKFFDNERTVERTVSKRMDVLLMEGVTLLDQRTYLTQQNLTMESYLIRKDPSLSEADFAKKVANAAPIPIEVQKQFYRRIDSQSKLFEILRSWPMPKSEWLPIMFNLVTCDVVVLADRPALASQKSRLSAAAVDRTSIDGAHKIMLRPDTGAISYQMMAYFLEYEFQRLEAGGSPFAFALFDMMAIDQYVGLQPPTPAIIAEVSRRIGLVTRKIDLLGHWETLGYALLLPQTDAAAASLVIARIVEVIRDGTMAGGISKDNLAIAFGVGCVPEDTDHAGVLLAGVKEARERAKRGSSPIVLMRSF